jgi:NAD(P)-dependent dehydrogenase (short-subunit alcohol dehydrogenase family)
VTTTSAAPAIQREPGLPGQTVVVIGGSAGIGLETARLARAEGASVVLTGRNPDRLEQAAAELGALRSAAFDATDPVALEQFFRDLPKPIDHVMVTAGRPYYGRLADIDVEEARRSLDEHLWLPINVARHALGTVRPGGTLLFMSGTGARRPTLGLAVAAMGTAAMPALIANLALELAPVRVNLIAPGFVDTPLSASLLGDELDKRRDQAPCHAAHQARGRTGRRRRARRAHHDQHSAHRRDVRHRRRPAVRLASMIRGNDLLKLAIEGHGGTRHWERPVLVPRRPRTVAPRG